MRFLFVVALALSAAVAVAVARPSSVSAEAGTGSAPVAVPQRPSSAEHHGNGAWGSIRHFGKKLQRMGSQAMLNVKEVMSSTRDQISDAVKLYANDPQAFMERVKQILPPEFYEEVKETLKQMGVEATPENVEKVLELSLMAAGIPSFFASKLAKPLTVQVFKLLGKDITVEEEQEEQTGVHIDLSEISENNGNLNLQLIPGSKATLGDVLEDGRTPVHLQIVGDLEYTPPVTGGGGLQQVPAIEAPAPAPGK